MQEDYLNEEQIVEDERLRAFEQDILELQQPISDLTQLQPIVSVMPDTSIATAIQLMVEHQVGCLLVTEDDALVGLFTERDVLRKFANQSTIASTAAVATVMTRNPETLPAESPLVFALHRMSVGGYRHVPLMNGENEPVAIVSMRDIVEHIVSLYPDQILNLPELPGAWDRDGG